VNIFIGLINGMISAATPILLAALGGTMTYYAGIFNIAMEGMMLSGAFFAVLGSYYFKSWPMGILCAILGALAMALIFILFAIVLKMDEFITGIGLNLFALGLTTYLLRQIFGVKGAFSSPDIVPIPRLDIPLIEDPGQDPQRSEPDYLRGGDRHLSGRLSGIQNALRPPFACGRIQPHLSGHQRRLCQPHPHLVFVALRCALRSGWRFPLSGLCNTFHGKHVCRARLDLSGCGDHGERQPGRHRLDFPALRLF